MGNDEKEPPLGPGPSDEIAAFLRMGAGALPGVGAALNELITKVIPGVRQQRIEEYLRFLNRRLEALTQQQLEKKFSNPQAVDLFEEGAFQSVRALSTERRKLISVVVANGVTLEDRELIEAKRILGILRELDDAQLIILASRLQKNLRNEEFQEMHKEILARPMAHLQFTEEEVDRSLVYDAGVEKLLSLGLLQRNFTKPKKGEFPEFDPKTGTMKFSGTSLSPFGRLFLKRIGLAEEGEN